MIYKPKQIARVVFGLFLFALGIVMTVNANLGVSPWDVFHQGLSKTFGITLGRANIITGLFIIGLDVVLGQTIGWATIMNMLLIGTFIDILMLNNLVPVFDSFMPSLIMLLLGVLIEGYGCFIYISGGMGAGPRDGLMVVLTRRTGKSVRVIKSAIEVIVVTVGIILGGKFGIGTLIMALFGGMIFQFAFKTVNFKVNQVQHRFIQDDLKLLKGGA
ncbi:MULTISPECIES: hypothetical protein [Gudongella]|jgi:uncharacterized membrane protein YczE|uniref:YczE/YyaS/YitT family protein n=1 Tax=Gudongella oleilytica TaxID=1582259 RepID=UPI002A35E57C|nr:hypothetical protein [Gudongella oleilytica]MDY0257606.1 hypothetical protein [Gudongella oleilytica]